MAPAVSPRLPMALMCCNAPPTMERFTITNVPGALSSQIRIAVKIAVKSSYI